MKIVFLFLFALSYSFCFYAQSSLQRKTKTIKVYENGKQTLYDSSNIEGKTMFFTLNQGYGSLVMNSAYIYDDQDRERFSIGCHSNLGFSISELEYLNERIYHYSYPSMTEDSVDLDASYYQQIDSYEKMINHPFVKQAFEKKVRILSLIEELNENGKIIYEYYIAENGDTTQINSYKYDNKGNQILFHYGDLEDSNWVWDVYSEYDTLKNMKYNYRIENGVKTEEYNYKYNLNGEIIYKDYLYEGIFHNKTEYQYDSNGLLIEEVFFESDVSKPKVVSKYEYSKEGILKNKIEIDIREPKKQQKTVSKYFYSYY